MKKSLYLRGTTAKYWYNATELLAMAILHRPVPGQIEYMPKVKYGERQQEYFNLFSPKNTLNKKRPLFLYIHGGGWISGVTQMRDTYVSAWAEKGFFAASVSYTYAPQKTFPFQLREIFKAIDFLYDHAEEYGIDMDNVVVSGESAGGYFISYLAACCCDNSLLDELNITFRHRKDFRIKAIISNCGCYSVESLTDKSKPQSKFPDIRMMLSAFTGMPLKQLREYLKTPQGKLLNPKITKDFPPCFVIWGDKDFLRYDAFDFIKKLDALGVEHQQFKADGIIGMHAWALAICVQKGKDCFNESLRFAKKHLPDHFG